MKKYVYKYNIIQYRPCDTHAVITKAVVDREGTMDLTCYTRNANLSQHQVH